MRGARVGFLKVVREDFAAVSERRIHRPKISPATDAMTGIMARRFTPVVAGLAAGAGVYSLLRWRRNKASQNETETLRHASELIDQAGLESFPASDPPCWTLGEDRTE